MPNGATRVCLLQATSKHLCRACSRPGAARDVQASVFPGPHQLAQRPASSQPFTVWAPIMRAGSMAQASALLQAAGRVDPIPGQGPAMGDKASHVLIDSLCRAYPVGWTRVCALGPIQQSPFPQKAVLHVRRAPRPAQWRQHCVVIFWDKFGTRRHAVGPIVHSRGIQRGCPLCGRFSPRALGAGDRQCSLRWAPAGRVAGVFALYDGI